MLLLEQKRRQEAQDRILRNIKEDTLCQALLHQRTRRNIEPQPLHESAATSLAGSSVLADECLKLLLQIASNLGNILQQVLLFDDGEIFESDAASQRTSAKSSAVLSR